MRVDDWIVECLINNGVTDVFGIPGVVVMDFLYAVDRKKSQITPHLNYHEQGAAFAAVGYAQSTGKLGVAYSTRGPGFTNMLTAIADAYYDSIPTLFITAHSTLGLEPDMRVMNNQEIDTVALAKSITKKAVRIDDLDILQDEIIDAIRLATTGRRGPVFIDIYNALFSKEMKERRYVAENNITENGDIVEMIKTVENYLLKAKRPVLLIGNGVRGKDNATLVDELATNWKVPILSSRGAQDIVPNSKMYYGFIGSRATRESNFILSKADLVIAIGNRMAFPIKSKSFSQIVENSYTIRIDADASECNRIIPNSKYFIIDTETAIKALLDEKITYNSSDEWINVCNELKTVLNQWDKNLVISNVMETIDSLNSESTLVCDVGNHSFWITTAYAYSKASNRIMYSGSFGTLGSALPKAIGAYYATRKPVICFTGDQGVQFNIQELQYISMHRLPVIIVILNNFSSGMIMEREIKRYGEHLVHTTLDSGYGFPDFEKVAKCYEISYMRVDCKKEVKFDKNCVRTEPIIIEFMIDRNTELAPSLPIGRPCQDLAPELDRELYEKLDRL